jgi:hypothetical protein
MRIKTGATIVAAAALMLVPATAGAVKKSSTSLKLTAVDADFGDALEDHDWLLRGAVKSGARPCVKGRSVRLTENGTPVGTARSRADGSFVVRFPLAGNMNTTNYEATATKRKVGSRNSKRICKPDSARLGFGRSETTVSIEFTNSLDRFSGELSPQHCATGNGWGLFAGSLSNPIAGGSLDAFGGWSHDYGSQPPAGTYIVATGFQWFASPGPAGALNVELCPSAISELTL